MWLFSDSKQEKEDEYPKTKVEQKEASKTYKTYDVKANTVSGKELSFQHEGKHLVSEDDKIYGNKVLPKQSGLRSSPLGGKYVRFETENQHPIVNLDNVETYDGEVVEKTKVTVYYKAELQKSSRYTGWHIQSYEIQEIEVEEVDL